MNYAEIRENYTRALRMLAESRDKVIKRQRYQLKMLNRYITKDKTFLEILDENKNLKKQIDELVREKNDWKRTSYDWERAFRCAEKSYKELKENK